MRLRLDSKLCFAPFSQYYGMWSDLHNRAAPMSPRQAAASFIAEMCYVSPGQCACACHLKKVRGIDLVLPAKMFSY